MALTATGASGNGVDVGSGASLDNITAGTFAAWVYITSLPGGGEQGFFGKGAAGARFQWAFDVDSLQMERARSTSICRCRVTYANFTNFAAAKWCFIACQWDESGAASAQKLFCGDLSTAPAEVTTYDNQQVGSGTHDDSASNLVLMRTQDSPTNSAMNGRMAWAGMFNRVLTTAELRGLWMRSTSVLSGTAGWWELGWPGTGTQQDLSGNGNHGTVTGATWVAHPPLQMPFHDWQVWDDPYVVAAGGSAFNPGRLALLGVGF